MGVPEFGITTAWSEYHLRRTREDKDSPVAKMLVENGFPHEVDLHNPSNLVFDWPVHVSKNSVFRNEVTAIEQLEHWKVFQDHWCEHKPSVTVYCREKEWPQVGGWVWDNFDSMSGVAFLPYSDHIYKQAPYEEITSQQYDVAQAEMPAGFDLGAEMAHYEAEDNTTASHELACVGVSCAI